MSGDDSGVSSGVGSVDGSGFGSVVGSSDGSGDGSAVARLVSSAVGSGVGSGVGSVDGSSVGSIVGSGNGRGDGSAVGSRLRRLSQQVTRRLNLVVARTCGEHRLGANKNLWCMICDHTTAVSVTRGMQHWGGRSCAALT